MFAVDSVTRLVAILSNLAANDDISLETSTVFGKFDLNGRFLMAKFYELCNLFRSSQVLIYSVLLM